jgi:protein tyrosine/serine phosphatase
MIHRLRKVSNGIFRGSAPNAKDVMWLNDLLGVKKIVSLDDKAAKQIERPCKLLGIKHVILPIGYDRKSLYHALSHDLKDLLLNGGPTYVHCAAGKDRTGLICALFKCKYMGEKPEKAIQEAKSLGFGIGIDPKLTELYEKIIRSCGSNKDNNDADIVSQEREYIGDNRDTFLDEARQDSWAPYLDHTRQNPMDAVYVYINDQGPTRQNYHQTWEEPKERLEDDAIKSYDDKERAIPQVGTFDNEGGARGFGPVENYSGFFYN